MHERRDGVGHAQAEHRNLAHQHLVVAVGGVDALAGKAVVGRVEREDTREHSLLEVENGDCVVLLQGDEQAVLVLRIDRDVFGLEVLARRGAGSDADAGRAQIVLRAVEGREAEGLHRRLAEVGRVDVDDRDAAPRV